MKSTFKPQPWFTLVLSLCFCSFQVVLRPLKKIIYLLILFQEWRVTDVVKDLSSPTWNLTLRAISYSAGPQPDHRSVVTTLSVWWQSAISTRPWCPWGWLRSLVSWVTSGCPISPPSPQQSPSTLPGTRPGQTSNRAKRASSWISKGPRRSRPSEEFPLGTSTATCFPGSPQAVRHCSCSPQLHQLWRSSQPLPSMPLQGDHNLLVSARRQQPARLSKVTTTCSF